MTLRAATAAGQPANTAPGTVTAGNQDGITYTLQSFAYGGNSHQSQIIGQTTTAVSTVAKTILTVTGDGTSFVVAGSDGTNKFSDMVVAGISDTPMVGITHTVAGTPAARAYSNAGAGIIQLAMASGTYSTNAFGNVAGQR